MILSVYINKQWISAVLCQENPIQIIDKAYIRRKSNVDSFSEDTIDDIFELIANEIKKELPEILSAKKVLVLDDIDNDIANAAKSRFDFILSFDQVSSAIGSRLVTLSMFDDVTQSLAKEFLGSDLNRYKTYQLYNLDLPEDILKPLIGYKLQSYINKRDENKTNLYEIIISTVPLKDRKSEVNFSNMVMSLLGDYGTKPDIYEITYDFGGYMLVIVAMLIALKSNIKNFFEENPVQIDAKVIVVPDLKDEFEIYINEGKADITDFRLKGKYKYLIDATEKDKIKIVAIDKTKKLNIVANGVIDGVYLDTK